MADEIVSKTQETAGRRELIAIVKRMLKDMISVAPVKRLPGRDSYLEFSDSYVQALYGVPQQSASAIEEMLLAQGFTLRKSVIGRRYEKVSKPYRAGVLFWRMGNIMCVYAADSMRVKIFRVF